MGSAYVNDFVQFGRIYQVKLGAAADSRTVIGDVLKLSVRNQNGDMGPFSAFTTLEEQLGLNLVNRYNTYSFCGYYGYNYTRIQFAARNSGDGKFK